MPVSLNSLIECGRALYACPLGYLLLCEALFASDDEPKVSEVPCVWRFLYTHIGGGAGF
jgi:hypothetical protein